MSIQDILAKEVDAFEQLTEKRAKRLTQIAIVVTFGMSLALVVAKGTTQLILMVAMFFMLLSAWFAWKKKVLVSAGILLANLFAMFSILVAVSGGIHDIGMLGYPVMLVLAAILGNVYLFLGLLIAVVSYASVIAIMTVNGSFQMVFPPVTYAHLIYINILLLATGFSVFLLTRDLHRLMYSLREENNRVKDREKTIVQLANQDQLTGLPNRRYVENYFEEFFITAKSKGKKVAVFFLDLDNFKPVNDSLGHAAGDLLLQQLAQRMESIKTKNDLLCRFGGDEFLWIVAIESTTQPELKKEIKELASKILKAALQSFHIMQNKIDITGSVGVAVAPDHGENFSDICRSADLAMYHAKTKGRNTFSCYDDDLNKINIDKYQLLKRMRVALIEEQFQVWYQPKFDFKANKINGCEALIRWPKENGEYISPMEFIPLAENSGLIAEIGLWVLEKACQDCKSWRDDGYLDVKVAVNVSYVQFRDGSLPKQIEQILCRTGLPAYALELELTESLLINDEDDIQAQLDELNAMGICIAIDDFGTGYSNLSYLRQFNARYLKIDQSFISALGISNRDESLVQAMVQMSHSLGLRTIAEGVETKECLDCLRLLDCDIGQGYFWSPALPLDKWREYLNLNAQQLVFTSIKESQRKKL